MRTGYWRHAVAFGVVAVVTTVAIIGARPYAQLMAPFYQSVMDSVHPSLGARSVTTKKPRLEWVFEANVVNRNTVSVGDRLLLPGQIDINSTTLIAHAAQHVLFIFGVALAGAVYLPLAHTRFVFGLLLAWFVVEVVDIPLVLLGSAWDLVLSADAPQRLRGSLLVGWMQFLTDGGRIGLCIAAGWMALLIGSRRPGSQRKRKD